MNRQQAKIIVEQWNTRSDEIICDHNGEMRLSVPEGIIVASLPMMDGSIVQQSFARASWITEQTYENAKRLLAATASQEAKSEETEPLGSDLNHDPSLQAAANELAKKTHKETGRKPTKENVAYLLYKEGLGDALSAETIERRIRKEW